MKSRPTKPASTAAAKPAPPDAPTAADAPVPDLTRPDVPYGTAVAIQSVFQTLLFGSAALAWQRDQSALELASRESGASFLAMLHFGTPMVMAVVALSRRLRGRLPAPPVFWLLAMMQLLMSVAALLAGASFLMRRVSAESAGLLAVGVTLVVLTGLPLVRGSKREGWERWAHLQAAVAPWHLLVSSVLLSEVGKRAPAAGIWLYLFAAPSLAPLYAWVVLGRRPLPPSPR